MPALETQTDTRIHTVWSGFSFIRIQIELLSPLVTFPKPAVDLVPSSVVMGNLELIEHDSRNKNDACKESRYWR